MKHLKVRFVVPLMLVIQYMAACSHGDQASRDINCNGQHYKIVLRKGGEKNFTLISFGTQTSHLQEISSWPLPYSVFHFECADIDGDGMDDILVGVIKPTRFDSISRKRIFIFKLVDGYVRPMWLGSRVSQPLEDFKVVGSGNRKLIRTIEIEQNGNYLVAEYKWRGFGLEYVKYMVRNVDLATARKQLAS